MSPHVHCKVATSKLGLRTVDIPTQSVRPYLEKQNLPDEAEGPGMEGLEGPKCFRGMWMAGVPDGGCAGRKQEETIW